MEKAYHLKDVFFRYSRNGFGLEIDNLEIDKGKIVALVGPNGSGKTTLLLILALIHMPLSGELNFFGQNPWLEKEQLRKRRKELCLVPHEPYFFKRTVLDNLFLGLKIRGIDEREWKRRAESALEMVGLAGFGGKHGRELSAGEMQRVALARAIVVKPKVLILDEPTANVDVNQESRICALLKEINAELYTTIIFSTHKFSQAYGLGDEVLYLSGGRIVRTSNENFFSGISKREGEYLFIELRGNKRLWLKGDYEGHITCVVSPFDIEISPYRMDIAISQRNCFIGTVSRLELLNEDEVRLRISGEPGFRVALKKRELEKKNIALGDKVLLKFAPEVVQVLN